MSIEYKRQFAPKDYFSEMDLHEKLSSEYYTAIIKNEKQEVVFKKEKLLFPAGWKQGDINRVARQYLMDDEYKFTDIIVRVVGWIIEKGINFDYFANEESEDCRNFAEILALLVDTLSTPLFASVLIVERVSGVAD